MALFCGPMFYPIFIMLCHSLLICCSTFSPKCLTHSWNANMPGMFLASKLSKLFKKPRKCKVFRAANVLQCFIFFFKNSKLSNKHALTCFGILNELVPCRKEFVSMLRLPD